MTRDRVISETSKTLQRGSGYTDKNHWDDCQQRTPMPDCSL